MCQAFLVLGLGVLPASVQADSRLGMSPCNLLAAPPTTTHPLRHTAPFAAAFAALDVRPLEPAHQLKVLGMFEKARDRLFQDATRAFTFKGDDIAAWDTRAAQRFLGARVLAANAPLRIGRDSFELAPPVVAAMMLAACRAGKADAAIAEARRTTADDARPLRAGALLLLLFPGDAADPPPTRADFQALARDLEPESFLDAFVLAEIALRGDELARARELNTLASKLATTADQHEAMLHQQRRLP